MTLTDKLEPNAVLDCTTQDDWGCIYATPVRIDVKGQPSAIKFSDACGDLMPLYGWTTDFKQFLTWKLNHRQQNVSSFDNDIAQEDDEQSGTKEYLPVEAYEHGKGIQDIGSIYNALINRRHIGPVIVRSAVLWDGRVYINKYQACDRKYIDVAVGHLFEKARELFVPR